MRMRDGRPTKKAILELCRKHGLIINALDMYASYGSIHYSNRAKSNEKAAAVVGELNDLGFVVRHSLAGELRTGCVHIEKKVP